MGRKLTNDHMLVKTLVAAHPGLLESLVYLHSRKDERLIRDDEFQRDVQRPTHIVGERSAYALEWVHRQCRWENLPGALYEYVFLTGADKPVSSEIRELVVAQIRQLEKDVRIEQFWEAVVQKFPSDSYWNSFLNDQLKEESSNFQTLTEKERRVYAVLYEADTVDLLVVTEIMARTEKDNDEVDTVGKDVVSRLVKKLVDNNPPFAERPKPKDGVRLTVEGRKYWKTRERDY